jgi:NADH-quinone oxidoreductase subunit C
MDFLRERFGDSIIGSSESEAETRLQPAPILMQDLSRCLRDELGYDYPADLAARDTGEEIVLWYRLYSMARDRTAIVHVRLDRDNPTVTSVTSIWPGMNWHERECFDLFGIRFPGHPDNDDPARMRILLPEDWEGHPFRKDYEPVFSGDPLHGPQETN